MRRTFRYSNDSIEIVSRWNHPNYNKVDTTMDDGTTGQVLGAGEKRILQLGLKFNF